MSQVTTQTIHGQGRTEVIFRRKGVIGKLIRLAIIITIWLGAGGFAALILIGSDTALFAAGWFALWLIVGGGFVLLQIVSAFGSERLIAYPDRLVLEHRFLLLRPQSSFPAETIADIRWLADNPAHTVRINGKRVPQTGIELLANGATLRLARGIGENEARQALAPITQRLRSYRRRAA